MKNALRLLTPLRLASRNFATQIACALLFWAVALPQAEAQWTVVGKAGFSAGPVGNTSLAFSGATPYVAYSDGANDGKATVMKFNLILPIELASFTGKNRGSVNLLEWSTASETRNDHFEVERGSDGFSFRSIGNIKGGGSTRTQQNYSYTDETPLSGVNYYRLKQVDLDGASTLSQTISIVSAKSGGSVLVYPTFTYDRVTIESTGLNIDKIEVFNSHGQVVAAQNTSGPVSLDGLPVGVYFLRLQAGAEIFTQKVSKL